MVRKFKRKPIEVIATRWFELGDHKDVYINTETLKPTINTILCMMEVSSGDWIVETDNRYNVLKDWYFKENYDEIISNNTREPIKFVYDCE